MYLRDEESGHFWSPTPLPSRGATPYVSRHGFGYSVFEHTEDGISSELWVYVALDAPVKFTVLKVRNDPADRAGCPRPAMWNGCWAICGQNRLMHVVTEIDPKSGAIFARNPYNTDFAGRIAFFDVDETTRTFTGDRTEFLGPQRHAAESGGDDPRAAVRARSARLWIPARAIQVPFELADGQEREIIFRLGVGRDADDARNWCIASAASAAARERARSSVATTGTHTLGAVHVETPDPSLNVLANGWLVYQTLACRLWARSGFYQSGGAFGFRDQLQDVDGADPRRAASCCASTFLRCAAVSSRKAMCSIGGIPRRAAACARTVRTIISGCPWRPAAMSDAPATPACLDERIPSSKAARSTPTRTRTTICRPVGRNRPRSMNIACAPF